MTFPPCQHFNYANSQWSGVKHLKNVGLQTKDLLYVIILLYLLFPLSLNIIYTCRAEGDIANVAEKNGLPFEHILIYTQCQSVLLAFLEVHILTLIHHVLCIVVSSACSAF